MMMFLRKILHVSFRKKLLLQKDTASFTLTHKSLNWIDLLGFGLGSTIGAGIFVLIGNQALKVGPALSLSFFLGACVCLFSGLCYAEFASAVPLCGSAYTYTYITLGELPALLIGWALLGEYIFSAGAVARGWVPYLKALVNATGGTYFPSAMDPLTSGAFFTFDLPCFLMIIFIILYLLLGIKVASIINWIFNCCTILALLVVIFYGAFLVNTDRWEPFSPGGSSSVFEATSVVFFAYIGFDMISSFAEEVKNPQKDIPLSIVTCVVICALLYVLITIILVGMVNYNTIHPEAPLTEAFNGHPWAQGIIAIGAIVSLVTSVQVSISSCTRMILAMSRDGLLPGFFSIIHSSTHEPWVAHLVTGFLVVLASFLYNLELLSNIVSLGALCAFTFVNTSVILLREKVPEKPTNNHLRKYLLAYILAVLLFSVIMVHTYLDIGYKVGLFMLATIPFGLIFYHFYLYLPFPIIVTTKHFVTPWVPLVPLVGIFFNIYLACSFRYETYCTFAIWLCLGVIVYSVYGVWNAVERRQEGVGERSPLFREYDYES